MTVTDAETPAKTRASRKPADKAAKSEPRETAPMNPVQVIAQAKQMLTEITGLTAETVSRFKANEGGYSLAIEIVEMKTLQGSSDVLATYEVQLDQQGMLVDYQRIRRYCRNDIGE